MKKGGTTGGRKMECEVREKKWGNKGGKGRERVKGRNSGGKKGDV